MDRYKVHGSGKKEIDRLKGLCIMDGVGQGN